MGGASKTTVLDCMIKNFKKGFVGNESRWPPGSLITYVSRIGYPLTLDSRQRALSASPLSKQCSRESLESRTSRSASIHRLLASNSTEPAPMGKSLYQQTGTQEGICDSTIQKERKKKPYIPGRPHRRPTAAPATRPPDSASPGTTSAGPTGRQ